MQSHPCGYPAAVSVIDGGHPNAHATCALTTAACVREGVSVLSEEGSGVHAYQVPKQAKLTDDRGREDTPEGLVQSVFD